MKNIALSHKFFINGSLADSNFISFQLFYTVYDLVFEANPTAGKRYDKRDQAGY
jgi:hypothetical protein